MRNDALEDIEALLPGPNDSYDPENTLIYTINSITDANQFCNTYNHNNRYNGLKLWQKIKINDGTYNTTWYIAGFDCEYNHTASDGTIKDNGYGICLVPETEIMGSTIWKNDIESSDRSGWSYEESDIHRIYLPQVSNSLQQVLGSHLINRDVLLGNSVSYSEGTKSYTWTKAYATLMSGCQLSGEQARWSNKYDDGEGNYQMPVYKFVDFWSAVKPSAWIRGVSVYAYAHVVSGNPYHNYIYALELYKKYPADVYPMIYIR